MSGVRCESVQYITDCLGGGFGGSIMVACTVEFLCDGERLCGIMVP